MGKGAEKIVLQSAVQSVEDVKLLAQAAETAMKESARKVEAEASVAKTAMICVAAMVVGTIAAVAFFSKK